jgi:alpha-amylase/alpha-mannosidase (GH57 family)
LFISFSGRVGEIITVTPAEYIDGNPGRAVPAHPIHDQDEIEPLTPGSWIFGNFTTWIGEPTKNRGWELLMRTRADVSAEAPRQAGTPAWEAAWEELLVAEGSDWFWWFGEGHDSGQDELFDYQFRLHLQGAYAALGLTPPDALFQPLSSSAALPPSYRLALAASMPVSRQMADWYS